MIERSLDFSGNFSTVSVPLSTFLLVLFLWSFEYLQEKYNYLIDMISKKTEFTYVFAGTVFVICFIIYSVTSSPQFIYFQF